MTEQPDPTPNQHPALWDAVLARMRERDQVGLERYGTRLQPFNGRHFGEDLMAELLDASVYLEGWITEHNALQGQLTQAYDLLRRIGEWDMLDATADGPYWKAEIKRLLDSVR